MNCKLVSHWHTATFASSSFTQGRCLPGAASIMLCTRWRAHRVGASSKAPKATKESDPPVAPTTLMVVAAASVMLCTRWRVHRVGASSKAPKATKESDPPVAPMALNISTVGGVRKFTPRNHGLGRLCSRVFIRFLDKSSTFLGSALEGLCSFHQPREVGLRSAFRTRR